MRRTEHVVFGTLAVLLFVFIIGGVLVGQAAPRGDIYEYLTNFREVLHLISANYVEEVDEERLMAGAFQGLMESLDSGCVYLDAAAYSRYRTGAAPPPASPGVTVSKRFIYAVIVSCLPGGPAARAGLTPGDLIRTIDGRPVREMNLLEAQRALQGEPGTAIVLSVIRQRNAVKEELRLDREVTAAPPLRLLDLPRGVRYLKLHDLSPGTVAQVTTLLRQSPPGEAAGGGMILDLRNNPGSLLQEAVALSDLFLDVGTVVSVERRQGEKETFPARPEDTLYRGPLVVLSDRGTAGAAEVAAAALQQNKRALLVGEPTFGQGSVQQAIPLSNGGALLLSVGRFYSPTGVAFEERGVDPDIEVRLEGRERPLAVGGGADPSSVVADPFVAKALEVLGSAQGAAASPAA